MFQNYLYKVLRRANTYVTKLGYVIHYIYVKSETKSKIA